jgi:hypothetical protein
MNDIKTCCIDSRRNALFASYDIKDPGNLKTIEDFFKKVEDFAKDCKDAGDFEAKFATSPLSQEYMNLFTQIAQTEFTSEGVAPSNEKEEEYTVADEMRDDAERAVRRRARQDIEDAARRTPVLGDAMTVKQHFDLFSRFKKNK